MEEIISLIQDGCKLARDLELNLTSSLATQPAGMLSYHCEEIIKAFGNARERLILFSQGQHIGRASLEEWLSWSTNYYYSQATDTIQARILGGNASGGHVQAMDVSYSVGNSNTTSSSQPRPRKRKDENNIRTEIMAAAQIGNTEIPLDDGFIWRKYGQKEILGSKFPRSYYRCTHQKLYSCPAKKQLQRDDEDPHMFRVTYRGNHTCNISGTSPSALSQPSDQMSHIHDHQILISQAMSNNGPLSLTTSYSVMTTPLLSRTGLSVDYGKELADQFPAVVDMADAMFNSGGSYSTNSMEFSFPSMESADDHPRKLND